MWSHHPSFLDQDFDGDWFWRPYCIASGDLQGPVGSGHKHSIFGKLHWSHEQWWLWSGGWGNHINDRHLLPCCPILKSRHSWHYQKSSHYWYADYIPTLWMGNYSYNTEWSGHPWRTQHEWWCDSPPIGQSWCHFEQGCWYYANQHCPVGEQGGEGCKEVQNLTNQASWVHGQDDL